MSILKFENEANEANETNEQNESEKEESEGECLIKPEKKKKEDVEKEWKEKLSEIDEMRKTGNDFFKSEDFEKSVEIYSKALENENLFPNRIEFSPIFGNRAACYLKLSKYEECIQDCNRALELDEKYLKVILRRANCFERMEKYEEALEDYKKAMSFEEGQILARQKIQILPQMIQERNEKLKDEMVGKLKDLGNNILGKFGLSLDNFQMKQDPKTGSYSVNFGQ